MCFCACVYSQSRPHRPLSCCRVVVWCRDFVCACHRHATQSPTRLGQIVYSFSSCLHVLRAVLDAMYYVLCASHVARNLLTNLCVLCVPPVAGAAERTIRWPNGWDFPVDRFHTIHAHIYAELNAACLRTTTTQKVTFLWGRMCSERKSELLGNRIRIAFVFNGLQSLTLHL